MYTHRVQYYETDQMGIVHHSNYIRWFEEARIDWMRHCGISYREMEKQGIIVPVLGVEATYRQMVHFDDLVDIKVKAAKSFGEEQISIDPEISEWGNPAEKTSVIMH